MTSEGTGTQTEEAFHATSQANSFPRPLFERLGRFRFSDRTLPFAFLGAVLLGYGIFIPWWGLYGDDWIYLWNYHLFGAGSFVDFVAVDRPFSAWIYMLSTPVFGETVWLYHVFLLALRWVSVFLLWKILRLLWPGHPRQTAWVAILFAVYPGFQQQPIAVQFILHFATLDLSLFSIWAMLQAVLQPRQKRFLTVLGLAASLSMFGIEYFVGLELLRPVLIWMILREEGERRQRLKRSVLAWQPYLIVLIAFGVWRVFIFAFPTYEPTLLYGLRENPVQALLELAKRILNDWKTALYGAWRQTLKRPTMQLNLYILLTIGTFLLCMAYMARLRFWEVPDEKRAWYSSWPVQAFALGGLSLVLVGWPFWVPNVPLNLAFPWDRSLLPFMPGVCLVIVAGVDVLVRPKAQVVVLSGLVALAVGFHFQNAQIYRDEWRNLQTYFWQMAWRMPGLQKGTVVISDAIPLWRYSDNDLTPLVNWIYAPESDSGEMAYKYFDMSTRVGSPLPGLEEGLPFRHTYRNTSFEGNTTDVLSIFYQAPGCMKVLDPAGDSLPQGLPETLLETLHLSHVDQIVMEGPPAVPPRILGKEPQHSWCYYYTQADLARQAQDWPAVAKLGYQAQEAGLTAAEGFSTEYLPFIEGYARTGNWDQALQFTDAAAQEDRPGVCKLWTRIEQSGAWTAAELKTIRTVQDTLGCSS